MNIIKFLLIDSTLVIAIISLQFFLQGRKKISPLFRSSNKEALLRKASVKLPDKEKLIKLEKLSRSQGSGIELDSLIGDWKIVSVWKKDRDEEDTVFTSLLRIFSANIKYKKDVSIDDFAKFSIITSIQFGLFTIEFSGSGLLKEKQTLLPFFFKRIEFKTGSNILFSRSLEEPEEKKKPFFALIALEENGKWLSARGYGGAILILLKD